ncbi:MAG TPA: hypothetical protein VIL20_02540, partial [Sandaracinaceae bacterium]
PRAPLFRDIYHAWRDASGTWLEEPVPAPYILNPTSTPLEAGPDGMLHAAFATHEHALVHARRRFCP